MFDIAEGVPQGKSLDHRRNPRRSTVSMRISPAPIPMRRSTTPRSAIVTAGVPRKPA